MNKKATEKAKQRCEIEKKYREAAASVNFKLEPMLHKVALFE